MKRGNGMIYVVSLWRVSRRRKVRSWPVKRIRYLPEKMDVALPRKGQVPA
jgi:hypothetical protein